MLRPGMLPALSLTGTFVDTLLRTDFAVRRHPSYAGAWPLPRPDLHRLEDTCFAGHAAQKKAGSPCSPLSRYFVPLRLNDISNQKRQHEKADRQRNRQPLQE